MNVAHVTPVCRLTVHRLAARTLIRSLEMEETERRGQQDGGIKEKVVELSVQSGVSSAFTAFIAVNKEDGEAIQGPLLRRDVPAPSECYPIKTNRNSFIECGTLFPCSIFKWY